ncbi:kinase-like domain-containing protein [Aspergillus avenaceus]|uniref:non-specific serine/threonine protein kinase n=1 Tax=Aspergillus avenaceus TaxID=36643 RepID=A0A5N6U969_ASPAV|nr:kinase-like domain-containing protein [Aspergillus avenaceus]
MHSSFSSSACNTIHNVEYMPIDDVEKLERYRPGGYHPVVIGEQLKDRYCIVHKLGFGAYLTVWLARDQQSGKYVAIKVSVSSIDHVSSQESNVLRRLGTVYSKANAHPGEALILPMLDEFLLSGPNGTHRCLVTVPGMMNLADAKDASCTRLFQLPVARGIVAQLIQAVAFLHSQGIVHGDLHEGNVLIRLPESIDTLSQEQLYERYGQPHHEPAIRLDKGPLPQGVPTHAVVPVWLGKESKLVSLPEAQVFLIDFGESFMPLKSKRYHSNVPDTLVPPEIRFESEKPLSFPSDIWTLACTIWTILGQRPLFEGYNPSSDCVVKGQVDTLGKLPLQWWLQWDSRARWFNEDGTRHSGANARPLVQRFRDTVQEPRRKCGMGEMGLEEEIALFDMLHAMLAFRPEERLTAVEVMGCEWMQRWALPELTRMKIG